MAARARGRIFAFFRQPGGRGKEKPEPKNLSTINKVSTAEPKVARPSVAVKSPRVSTPRVKARPSAVTRTKSREAPRVSHFQSRINKIRKGISSGKFIRFNYTNLDGIESVRSIKPYVIKQLEDGIILSSCVHGYCHLRKENRTFAIARMRSVKVENTSNKGYYKNQKTSNF